MLVSHLQVLLVLLYYIYRVHDLRLLNQQQKIYFTEQARDQILQCFYFREVKAVNKYKSNMYIGTKKNS